MTRQSTSKEILDVDWDFPVASTFEENQGSGHTFAAKAKVALAKEDAFKKISGEDFRPLLVMRECTRCKGSEHALFNRRFNNEKTKLLLNWFHCVKLPPECMEKDHAFHAVFATKYAYTPHLFISMADGSKRMNFSGAQPQTLLQRELIKLIKASYAKNPKPAIKMMLRYLSKFDMYDLREQELLGMIDKVREEKGPKSSSYKRMQKKVDKVRKDKARVMKSTLR